VVGSPAPSLGGQQRQVKTLRAALVWLLMAVPD
jgi:hypothetical protein